MTFDDYRDIANLTAENQLNSQEEKDIRLLDIAIQKDPFNLEARVKKAFILFEAHMDGQAIKVLNEVLTLNPQYVDAYMWLGEFLLFHWADSESAIPLLKEAQNIDPNRAEIYYLLGCAYSKRDKINEAILHTQKAAQLEPTWPHPRMCLIDYLLLAGRTDEARVELQELDRYLEPSVPEPEDEMERYYENLFTGRYMGPYKKEWLEKLRTQLSAT